jgi:hypothetical protein
MIYYYIYSLQQKVTSKLIPAIEIKILYHYYVHIKYQTYINPAFKASLHFDKWLKVITTWNISFIFIILH